MSSSHKPTIWINPWALAKRLAVPEGRRGVPGERIEFAPGQSLLREIGNAGQSEKAAGWYAKEPKLAAPCHESARNVELAAIRTREAQERVSRRARLIEAFHRRTDVEKNALHRGLGHVAYGLALGAFTLIESYLNLGALLLLGESDLQLAYALGLGVAQLLLARAIGKGLKDRQMDAPHAASARWLAALGIVATGLLISLAVLRAEALSIALRVAVSEAAANSTGSAAFSSSAPVDPPSSSWLWYGLLQLGVFVAACACSRAHANWLADERDRLAHSYRGARWNLYWRLSRQAKAAAASDKARGRWGAAFVRKLEEADEAGHWNMVTQSRYGHWNLLSRDGEVSDAVEPMPLAAKAWREAPDPADRIPASYRARVVPLWADFTVPGPQIASTNGHRAADVIRLVPDATDE